MEVEGTSEISRTTETSSETHYYDNVPAIVIITGADEVKVKASAIPLIKCNYDGTVLRRYNRSLHRRGAGNKIFCHGVQNQKTNGKEVYVWRYSVISFCNPGSPRNRRQRTTANGQNFVTGIVTTYKFKKTETQSNECRTEERS